MPRAYGVAERVRAGLAYIPADRERDQSRPGDDRRGEPGAARRAVATLCAQRLARPRGANCRRRPPDPRVRHPRARAGRRRQHSSPAAISRRSWSRARSIARPTCSSRCRRRGDSTRGRRASSWIACSTSARRGAAVLYISSELEEVLAIGDRIGVLFGGRLVAVLARAEATAARIGLLMAGAQKHRRAWPHDDRRLVAAVRIDAARRAHPSAAGPCRDRGRAGLDVHGSAHRAVRQESDHRLSGALLRRVRLRRSRRLRPQQGDALSAGRDRHRAVLSREDHQYRRRGTDRHRRPRRDLGGAGVARVAGPAAAIALALAAATAGGALWAGVATVDPSVAPRARSAGDAAAELRRAAHRG